VLGGDSRVLTSFDKEARRLTLERGEAYFRVEHDRTRPFIVTAGHLRVTAVGTAFNVRTSSDRVVVAVAEGIVAIEPPPLSLSSDGDSTTQPDQERPRPLVLRDTLRASAGQEVVLDIADEQLQVARVEPKAVASWQTGRLEFTREPLRAVLASVNRYSVRTVTLGDPALGELRFTGTVFADRVDDWIRGLPAVFPVTVRDEGTNLVVESRAQDASAAATMR
jgi:transmembrane sensor